MGACRVGGKGSHTLTLEFQTDDLIWCLPMKHPKLFNRAFDARTPPIQSNTAQKIAKKLFCAFGTENRYFFFGAPKTCQLF